MNPAREILAALQLVDQQRAELVRLRAALTEIQTKLPHGHPLRAIIATALHPETTP